MLSGHGGWRPLLDSDREHFQKVLTSGAGLVTHQGSTCHPGAAPGRAGRWQGTLTLWPHGGGGVGFGGTIHSTAHGHVQCLPPLLSELRGHLLPARWTLGGGSRVPPTLAPRRHQPLQRAGPGPPGRGPGGLTSVMLSMTSKLLTFSSHVSRRLPGSGFTKAHTSRGAASTTPSPRYLRRRPGAERGGHHQSV